MPVTRRGKKKKYCTTILLLSLQRGYAWIQKIPTLTLVGDGQFFSAFSASCGQNSSAVGGGHSLAESVLISSLSA
jgi:hypothetical protein